jgi:hypothetical protein
MAGMSRSTKMVGAFAVVGFVLPLVMLAYYARSGTGAGDGFVRVCPSCIMSMALDNASTATALFVWLIICASNAVIYALPGAAIAFLLNLKKRN